MEYIVGVIWLFVGVVFYLKVRDDTRKWPQFWQVAANLIVYGLMGYAIGNIALAYVSLCVAVLLDRFGRNRVYD